MPPEVLEHGTTSKQSDVYQVGLLLYWMNTGVPTLPQNLPEEELFRLVRDGEPRRRAEAVGSPLDNVIARMLRRREAYRYTSPREVWADLRELEAWKTREIFPLR